MRLSVAAMKFVVKGRKDLQILDIGLKFWSSAYHLPGKVRPGDIHDYNEPQRSIRGYGMLVVEHSHNGNTSVSEFNEFGRLHGTQAREYEPRCRSRRRSCSSCLIPIAEHHAWYTSKTVYAECHRPVRDQRDARNVRENRRKTAARCGALAIMPLSPDSFSRSLRHKLCPELVPYTVHTRRESHIYILIH